MAKVQKVGREFDVVASVDRYEVVGGGSGGDVLGSGIEAVKARVSFISSGQHVDYHVRVIFEGQSWTVTRRFNEFAALSDVLSKRLASVPEMPQKSVVRQFSHEYLEARRAGLTAFLRELCKRRDALNCRETQDFLLLMQRMPRFFDVGSPEPVQSAEVQESTFGIADLDYDPVQGLLVLGSTDFSWTSRVDTKITNIKMPWEKKAPNLPSSQMSLWHQAPSELRFEMQAVSRFTASNACVLIAASRDKPACLCGLSDGTIGVQPLRPDRDARSGGSGGISVLPLVRHNSAVVALALDEAEQWLFSASSDKAIIVFDLKRQMIQCEVQAPAAPTKMLYCQDHRKLFTATKSGVVVVWDTSFMPMQKLATIPDGGIVSNNPITAMDFDAQSGTLFTGSKEGIVLWAVKTNDNARGWGRKLGQISNITSAPNCLAFLPSSREVVAGFASGAVVIFDIDRGEASYSIKAHTDAVTTIRWLDAPRRLLTASKDRTMKIWDFPSMERAPLDSSSLGFQGQGFQSQGFQSQDMGRSYDTTRTQSSASGYGGSSYAGPGGGDPLLGRGASIPQTSSYPPSTNGGGYGFGAPLSRSNDPAALPPSRAPAYDPGTDPYTGQPAPLRASGLSGAPAPTQRPHVAGAPASATLAQDDSDDDLAGWAR